MKEIQPGIFEQDGKIYTESASEHDVYGETRVDQEGREFRRWSADRSKIGAAVQKGFELEIDRQNTVLYLGAASGTTVSHVSDILSEGSVYAVEYSDTVARKLLEVAESRENIAPMLADARKPGEYPLEVPEVDVVFQDISQRDQPEIFLRNIDRYLRDDGVALLALKVRSISSSDSPEEVLEDVRAKLEEELEVVEVIDLEPYETEHFFIKMRKK